MGSALGEVKVDRDGPGVPQKDFGGPEVNDDTPPLTSGLVLASLYLGASNWHTWSRVCTLPIPP